ncbi:DUF362 domain-containing protein [bacterium]|nr:DUF362 domain-containing protein [bacterium]
MKVDLLNCRNRKELREKLSDVLDNIYSDLFPSDKKVSILIKPNLNSNMNSLTGNTTDLRLLAVVIEYLKDRNYANITVGEGTNSGFFRAGVNVIRRLRVDELARYYNVKVVDFNHSDTIPIELEDGVKANIARDCLESGFFINIPKLKTHFETEMTVCLKSLIGCLAGRENKKKAHSSLIKNILKLNDAIKPDLQIVDGLIAMEGTGPSLGEPKKIDTVLIGTNPYLLDMIASKIAGYDDFRCIPVLREALKQKKIDDFMISEYNSMDMEKNVFKRPEISFWVALTINPRVQKYLIKIRYAPLINRAFNWEITRRLLFGLGISQDFIVFKEPDVSLPYLVNGNCMDGCAVCNDICPVGFDLPGDFGTEKMRSCIKCLYCYSACPQNAVKVDGDMGFFNQQNKQYEGYIRRLFVEDRS